MLAELESGVRADIAALQVALEGANGAALRSAAHRIKGSALTIGAERLAALAARIMDAPAGVDAPQLMSSAHGASRRAGTRPRLRTGPAERDAVLVS